MESSEMGGGAVSAATSVYVVQEMGEMDEAMGVPQWLDIATVEVPSKTKRVTVIDTALAKAGRGADGVGPLRVLDEDSAKPWAPKAVVPPPVTRWSQD